MSLLNERVKSPKMLFRMAFGHFAVLTVCLPLLGFLFCVFYSVLIDFEKATHTHCEVRNYLPSISAAIGRYQPQRFVWQLAICLLFLPRLVIAKMYVLYYRETISTDFIAMAYFVCVLNVIENFALLGLSMWTSSEQSYKEHKICFLIFIATNEVFMFTSYYLNKNGRKKEDYTIHEKLALIIKRNLFIVNVIAIALAGYFFKRHNDYCEPGVYTFFALFEYTVVLINIGYHMTAYWDFCGRDLSFDWQNGFTCPKSKSS